MNYEGYGIIYCIKNLINNKVYIGQTKQEFNRRYSGSKWWKYTSNIHLRFSVLKYGIECFQVTILDVAKNIDELNHKESYWISEKKATNSEYGYNIFEGGTRDYEGSSVKKGPLPQDVIDRIRETALETWKNDDLKERHSKALSDWWHSLPEEKINEILEKRSKTKADPEWREYLSEQIKKGHAARTGESKTTQYNKQKETNQSKDPELVKADYAKRSENRKKYWESLSTEEREARLTAKNEKIRQTLLAKSDPKDYEARIIKRKGKSEEELMLSEEKRLKSRAELDPKVFQKPPIPHPVTVYLVAGPSGIGKSWLCKQLSDKITYVGYDEGRHAIFYNRVYDAAMNNEVLLVDLPINVSTFIRRNQHLYNIIPVFIEESEEVHKIRLEGRGGIWKQSIISRREALRRRAVKYAAFTGTSSECLAWLSNI